MQNPTSIRPRFIALALVSVLAACSNDYVDLGGGTLSQSVENVERGSRCAESVIVEGDVLVQNQEELDALLGCEEVRGNLMIQIFEDTELTALAELRAVDGTLGIGVYPEVPSDPDANENEAFIIASNRLMAIAEANWLPSLAGLESLERFGGLILNHISAPSLDAFESLRLVTGGTSGQPGVLSISAAPHLVELSGLRNAPGFGDIQLQGNPALETLNGLHVGQGVDNVMIVNNPALTSIDELSSLREAFVSIEGTAITNVDALANLLFASVVALTDNPELTSVDGLVGLASAEDLIIERNAKLERLPELRNINNIGSFKVTGNPALESLSLDFPNVRTGGGGSDIRDRVEIRIGGNGQLRSVVFGAGLTAAGYVEIGNNANLASVDLGNLRGIENLSITRNTSLAEVELGALQTVSSLSVSGNPSLPTTELRNVRTLESAFDGNADDPPPAP